MNKDIRFAEKKIDDSWKESARREQEVQTAKTAPAGNPQAGPAKPKATSRAFYSFLSSLGYQVLMHLGEVAMPGGMPAEENLDAAREILDILAALKEKTEGNLSEEEKQFFLSFLPELQLKYANKV